LGSGTGKGVLTAALIHPFERVVGIELLEDLYAESVKMKAIYDAVKMPSQSHFDVYMGDILQEEVNGFDWSTADLILMNSACFDQPMIERITIKANKMKIGSWFLTLQRKLHTSNVEEKDCWQLMIKIWLPMSWAPSPVYVHKKVS